MFVERTNHQEPIRPWKTVNKSSLDVAGALRVLISDAVTFYNRAHGFHWNVKGIEFSQFHELFGEIYADVYGSIDPIAENMLKMGVDAPYRLSDYIQNRTIQEIQTSPTDPIAMALNLMEANTQILNTLNMVFTSANNSNEQGVANFIAERIDSHQKWDWQLKASLTNR
jgi:starvation-inducible DNA-binding protein